MENTCSTGKLLTVRMLCCETQIAFMFDILVVGFVKLVQKLRNYIVLLILVCIRKPNFAKVFPMEFVNVKILKVFTNQQIGV